MEPKEAIATMMAGTLSGLHPPQPEEKYLPPLCLPNITPVSLLTKLQMKFSGLPCCDRGETTEGTA